MTRLFTLHFALWLWALLWLVAFERAHRLGADVLTRLLVLFAFHLACWFAALCLALSAGIVRAEMLWADHQTIRLVALHLATVNVKAFASCRAHGRIALRSANFFARLRLTLPFTDWIAIAKRSCFSPNCTSSSALRTIFWHQCTRICHLCIAPLPPVAPG